MKTFTNQHYQFIAKAIRYIDANYQLQPSLDQIAKYLNLSPFHFQRLFNDWAGISPKKFLQFISTQHAKKLLREKQQTIFDTAYNTGLSGSSRLHDLFIKIEGMSPAEYKNGGSNLNIDYSFDTTPIGEWLIASTKKGICFISFFENRDEAMLELTREFPKALFNETQQPMHHAAKNYFDGKLKIEAPIHLHVKGSSFQLKVWEALLSIPEGRLTNYSSIAKHINQPKASRAVGSAIGSNHIALLIPCHRVIQSTGLIGGYKWDVTRKKALIAWESRYNSFNGLDEA